MEDIFDNVNNNKIHLNADILKILISSLEVVAKFLQESIKNNREIIDDTYTATISALEQLSTEDNEEKQNILIADVQEPDKKNGNSKNQELIKNQEVINLAFNNCFEIIDSIVPEEESQDIVLLDEEVQKIYAFFKDSDLYEVKSSLENIIAKIDFVMNATNTLTISEILELRNELSSAVAKFSTSCIETEDSGFTFFDVAEKINSAKKEGRPVLAVGTTSVRTLESASDENGIVHGGTRSTNIFMYPGYKFKVVDQMFTNFHTPESTLIMLVSAFAGRENILNAYKIAVENRYRFFSYGDAMLIK